MNHFYFNNEKYKIMSDEEENLLEKKINNRYNLIEPFLYRDIIFEKSNNIIFEINKPTFEKTVLKCDQPFDGEGNSYYTIIHTNNEYRMFYRALAHNLNTIVNNNINWYSSEFLRQFETTYVANSNDGLNFNNFTFLFSNNSHNFSPYYLENFDKYIGISGCNYFQKGLYLLLSDDGINWHEYKKIIDDKNIMQNYLHDNHFDTLNCIVKNNQTNTFYIYYRHNLPGKRQVQYTKTKDFTNFTKCKLINIINNDIEFYCPGIFNYFNSNYIISIPTNKHAHTAYTNDKACNYLLVSYDYVNWHVIDNNLFDKNINMINVNGIVASTDNKKMFIYTQTDALEKTSRIDCYSYPIHRINKIICKEKGYIKTKMNLLNKNISLNFETFENGYIIVQIYDDNNKMILKSSNITGNNLDHLIKWDIDINFKQNDIYIIKFIINNACLYSFTYNIK